MQLRVNIIDADDPSQLVSSVLYVTPSLCLILIVYDVIADPPLLGAAQESTTPVFEMTDVEGELGAWGLEDARTESSELKPE